MTFFSFTLSQYWGNLLSRSLDAKEPMCANWGFIQKSSKGNIFTKKLKNSKKVKLSLYSNYDKQREKKIIFLNDHLRQPPFFTYRPQCAPVRTALNLTKHYPIQFSAWLSAASDSIERCLRQYWAWVSAVSDSAEPELALSQTVLSLS